MVCTPVRSIIPSLKLGDYLSVQAHKPCSILKLGNNLSVQAHKSCSISHLKPMVTEGARSKRRRYAVYMPTAKTMTSLPISAFWSHLTDQYGNNDMIPADQMPSPMCGYAQIILNQLIRRDDLRFYVLFNNSISVISG